MLERGPSEGDRLNPGQGSGIGQRFLGNVAIVVGAIDAGQRRTNRRDRLRRIFGWTIRILSRLLRLILILRLLRTDRDRQQRGGAERNAQNVKLLVHRL